LVANPYSAISTAPRAMSPNPAGMDRIILDDRVITPPQELQTFTLPFFKRSWNLLKSWFRRALAEATGSSNGSPATANSFA